MSKTSWAGISASTLLGIIFIAASVGKFLASSQMLATEVHLSMFMPAALAALVSDVVPFIELVLGVLLISGVFSRFSALIAAPLIAGFIFTNTWLIASGLGYEVCDCLGALDKLLQVRLSTRDSLVFDGVLVVLVLVTLRFYPGELISGKPWYMKLNHGAKE